MKSHPVALPDVSFSLIKSQGPSVLVIGHRWDTNAQCVLWDEDEPNIADYDVVIVDLTINPKPLLPLYRPRLWHDPQFNKLNFLNWTHTRSRIESLVSSGGMIFFIVDSSLVKHIDSPKSYGEKYSRLLPFTLYGEHTPIGTTIKILDSRFDFYFSSLGSWNFIFSDQIDLDFECTSNHKITSIAQNRANESLAISIELNRDKLGWIHILPKPSNMTSFVATKLLVANLGRFV
jgi:hypothetical protein